MDLQEGAMKQETTHFNFYFHEEDSAFAERYHALLEEKYEEIHQFFGFGEGSCKYNCVLCKDVEEYIEKTGKKKEEYQSWMVGYSDVDTYTISILSPRVVTDRSEADMEQVVVHELVHMIFDDSTKMREEDVEVWIAEGIAILYANQTDVNYVSREDYPRISELVGFDNFADNGGYDYAGMYVRHFIETYGFEKFVKVYRQECDWRELIYEGFEKEAIDIFLKKGN